MCVGPAMRLPVTTRVLAEAHDQFEGNTIDARRESIESEVTAVEAKQRRLVKLFTAGDLPESMLSSTPSRATRRVRLR